VGYLISAIGLEKEFVIAGSVDRALYTSYRPFRVDAKAIFLPSGDQTGASSARDRV
jgi:hypothetical protein